MGVKPFALKGFRAHVCPEIGPILLLQEVFMKAEYLLDEQVERVLAALTPVNRLVMRVCLHTGLRIGDVLAFRTQQVQKGPRWWITEQKTGKRRMVALPVDLWQELCAQAGDPWVFPGRCDPAKHRTRQAVWKDVKRAAWAFRLDSVNASPHSARKIYAVKMLEEYGSIAKVQRALNHSSQSVTMIYVMADKLLKAKHRKRRRRS